MEIIPLIPERDVAIQRARVAQNRDVRTQAKACLLLGRYYKEQGEFHKAEALYQRALAKARQWRAHEMEADACSGLGLMYQVKGQMDEFDDTGDDKGRAIQAALLGDAYMDIGPG